VQHVMFQCIPYSKQTVELLTEAVQLYRAG
jgi:hypothetical protein